MLDLEQYLTRQMVFSKATFGPGFRTAAILNHISEEIDRIQGAQGTSDYVDECADLVILSLDLLTRAIWTNSNYRRPADVAARAACDTLFVKQQRNELRDWPDWRGAFADTSDEPVRGEHD